MQRNESTMVMAGSTPETGRGISDLLGYVLVFSIVVTGVGLVSFGALDFLVGTSDSEQIETSERGLAAAAATLDDLHRESDTRRAFKLAINGGIVFVNESNITVSSADAPAFNRTYSVNSLEQVFDRSPRDVTVAYEGGGVFRSPGAGARYRPSIRCTENDVVVVSLVRLEADNFFVSEGADTANSLNPRSLPSDSPVGDFGRTLIFSAELTDSHRNYTTFAGTGTVRINVSESANAAQWNSYFRRPDSEWTEVGDGTWACQNVESALVRVVTVRLRV